MAKGVTTTTLYHITRKASLPRIRRRGLLPSKNSGVVYLSTNPVDPITKADLAHMRKLMKKGNLGVAVHYRRIMLGVVKYLFEQADPVVIEVKIRKSKKLTRDIHGKYLPGTKGWRRYRGIIKPSQFVRVVDFKEAAKVAA